MVDTVAEVMSQDVQRVEIGTPVVDAARRMHDFDTGDVVIVDDGVVVGIVTDRDIVTRVVAQGLDGTTPVEQACSTELVTIEPDAPLDIAAALMRARAVRRLPVVDAGRPVGVVSIGDLAIVRDPGSAITDISATRPDNPPEVYPGAVRP